MDQGQLDALYQQYLGRGVDPSGAASWANADYNTVVQGILGSQEYQNRNQGGSNPAPVSGGGGAPTDINSIYQQYLGRGVDASGAATYAGWNPQDIINAVTSSQEYANRSGGGAGQAAPTGSDAASQVAQIYQSVLGRAPDAGAQDWINAINSGALSAMDVTNQIAGSQEAQQKAGKSFGGNDPNNFSGDVYQLYSSALGRAPTSQELTANVNALYKDPDAFAWITRQLTDSPEGQARAASYGTDPEQVYQNLAGAWDYYTPSPEQGGIGGFFNRYGQYLPYLAAAAMTAGAASGLAAGAGAAGAGAGAAEAGALTTAELMGGAGGAFTPAAGSGASFALPGWATAGSVGTALPYTEAFDAANLYANGITNAGQLGDILASTGMDPFLAADMGSLAAQGLSAEQIAQVMGYSYTPAELAGTGIESFVPGAGSAASTGLSASTLANALKAGSSLVSAGSKLLGGSTGTTGTSPLTSALRNVVPTTAMTGAQNPGTFSQIKGNVNPFSYAKDVPTQTLAASKADPFAALNVPQTPVQPFNPLANLFG